MVASCRAGMDRRNRSVMKLSQALGLAFGGIVISAAFVSPASAGCGDVPRPGQARILPMSDRSDDGPSIVGLWQFTFISVGNENTPAAIPDNAVRDQGFTQGHPHGAAIMSSPRDPVTT